MEVKHLVSKRIRDWESLGQPRSIGMGMMDLVYRFKNRNLSGSGVYCSVSGSRVMHADMICVWYPVVSAVFLLGSA
jgi:hypothetical protein